MEVSCSEITFRIDIDFPECDVDMALAECFANTPPLTIPGIGFFHTITPGSKTPTDASVQFCLAYLSGCARKTGRRKWEIDHFIKELPEFEALGVEVKETYNLLQGTCHLKCVVDAELFNSELVEKVKRIVKEVFDKYIIYYQT